MRTTQLVENCEYFCKNSLGREFMYPLFLILSASEIPFFLYPPTTTFCNILERHLTLDYIAPQGKAELLQWNETHPDWAQSCTPEPADEIYTETWLIKAGISELQKALMWQVLSLCFLVQLLLHSLKDTDRNICMDTVFSLWMVSKLLLMLVFVFPQNVFLLPAAARSGRQMLSPRRISRPSIAIWCQHQRKSFLRPQLATDQPFGFQGHF